MNFANVAVATTAAAGFGLMAGIGMAKAHRDDGEASAWGGFVPVGAVALGGTLAISAHVMDVARTPVLRNAAGVAGLGLLGAGAAALGYHLLNGD